MGITGCYCGRYALLSSGFSWCGQPVQSQSFLSSQNVIQYADQLHQSQGLSAWWCLGTQRGKPTPGCKQEEQQEGTCFACSQTEFNPLNLVWFSKHHQEWLLSAELPKHGWVTKTNKKKAYSTTKRHVSKLGEWKRPPVQSTSLRVKRRAQCGL